MELKQEKQVINSSKSYIEQLTNGINYYGQGRYSEAVEELDKALNISPKSANALYYKGLALTSLGNYSEGIQYFDKALEIDPKNVNALSQKGLDSNFVR